MRARLAALVVAASPLALRAQGTQPSSPLAQNAPVQGAMNPSQHAAPSQPSVVTVVPPKPVATPRPFARLSASAHALRDSMVAYTLHQLGTPYRRGADSPDHGFDCSGLVRYVMAHFGAEVPRTSHEQAMVGERIERDIASLKPGDLLTFGRGKGVSHVGIYIGNGRYVHAPAPGRRVREEILPTGGSWWKGARRVIALAGVDSAPVATPAN